MTTSSNGSTPVDKEALYGEYLKNQRWREKLYKSAAHKSLDVPEDDMSITQSSTSGMGWKELAAVAAMVLGSGGLGAYLAGKTATPATTTPPAVTAPATPGVPDSEYDVRFYDKDGKLIDVRPVAEKPK